LVSGATAQVALESLTQGIRVRPTAGIDMRVEPHDNTRRAVAALKRASIDETIEKGFRVVILS
tara:strand:- start:446 stop:634 length:189 start_codon:yes stop_codon:yes gene_type:complete